MLVHPHWSSSTAGVLQGAGAAVHAPGGGMVLAAAAGGDDVDGGGDGCWFTVAGCKKGNILVLSKLLNPMMFQLKKCNALV